MRIGPIDKDRARVEIINSIKDTHKDLRQRSKGCTFALTYAGTWITLMKNFGFSEEEAKHIEAQYHELYKESDEFIAKKLEEAERVGYATVAFGLRVRTHKLAQTITGNRSTPKEAEGEKRTVGNAMGQSYGLLNTRAGIEFNNIVRNSKYKDSIKPVAHIHDAQYFLIKDNPDVVLFANKHLVHCVSWQNDKEIAHPLVHLGGEFSIFYPDWAHELTIPNVLTKDDLLQSVKKYMELLNGK